MSMEVSLEQRRAMAKQLAEKLDAADGKDDGCIKGDVWNEFVADKGGKQVRYGITVDNATNSISSYLANNAATGNTTVSALVNLWDRKIPQPQNGNTGTPTDQSTPGNQGTTTRTGAGNQGTQTRRSVRTEQDYEENPRSQAEIDAVEAKYAEAEALIANLMGGIGAYQAVWDIQGAHNPLSGLTAEDIAYILAVQPNFFEDDGAYGGNVTPNKKLQNLQQLAINLRIPYAIKTVDQLIDDIKQAAAGVTVDPRPTQAEKDQRAALDHQAVVARDRETDKQAIGQPTLQTQALPTEAESLAHYRAKGFSVAAADINNLKLAIATGDDDILDALYSKTVEELRTILKAMIGPVAAKTVEREDLADKIVEVSVDYKAQREQEIATFNANVDTALEETIPQAVDIVTLLENDPENAQIVIGTNDYVMYNTETNEAVWVIKDTTTNKWTFKIGTYNPSAREMTVKATFNQNNKCTINGQEMTDTSGFWARLNEHLKAAKKAITEAHASAQ